MKSLVFYKLGSYLHFKKMESIVVNDVKESQGPQMTQKHNYWGIKPKDLAFFLLSNCNIWRVNTQVEFQRASVTGISQTQRQIRQCIKIRPAILLTSDTEVAVE